jgi:uncharacterized membrane protein
MLPARELSDPKSFEWEQLLLFPPYAVGRCMRWLLLTMSPVAGFSPRNHTELLIRIKGSLEYSFVCTHSRYGVVNMAFCPSCGAQIQGNATFCGGCGKSTAITSAPSGSAAAPVHATAASPAAGTGLSDNVAGLLAYLLIPAIIFLLIDPYKKNRFVRFHSFQCVFFAVAWFALWIVLMIFATLPFVTAIMLFLAPLISLAGLVLGIFLMVKAYQGELFKLPVIGDLAEKQANAV